MKDQIDEQEKEAKFKEFFEKARKGVLKYLDENGGFSTYGKDARLQFENISYSTPKIFTNDGIVCQ